MRPREEEVVVVMTVEAAGENRFDTGSLQGGCAEVQRWGAGDTAQ